MSSKFVRDTFIEFITTEFTNEKLVDLTAEFDELDDLLEYNGIEDGNNWLGIQFIGSEEIPVDIRSTNSKGTYREVGVFYIHVVAVARIGGHNDILVRAEAIRDMFRGRRIGTILIDSVSPPNFGSGVSIDFDGGYTSATFTVSFERQFSL